MRLAYNRGKEGRRFSMEIKNILVIFKTHLDIGFTDYSAEVTKKYMNSFLPGAAEVAASLREKNGDAEFIWTTGSWLISEYLSTHNDPEDPIIKGIENGDIRWHGLPFTTHTELMSGELFDYGLSLSAELDKRFGRKTVAAKMTDVPGHTKAIIPHLKKAGIEFLHIGVNPASAVPEVPGIFKWQADNGDCINVMYQKDYGEFSQIADTDTAVYFAHTGDNQGVQAPEKIEEIFSEIREKYPEASIKAGDLNDLAAVVRTVQDTLPVVTDEIGDSWIHGVGTDPKKVSCFKGLERFWKQLPECEDKAKLGRALLMIPEHTWGLNVHVNLGDHEHYDRESFNEIRKTAVNFKRMEESWREQRRYLTDAVDGLSEVNRRKAEVILSEAERDCAQKYYSPEIAPKNEIGIGDFKLRFNSQGEIVWLKYRDKVLADGKNRMLSLVYEQFCADDYKRFFSQYNRCEQTWAYEDYTKPGIETGSTFYRRFEPLKATVYPVGERLTVRYSFDKEAHAKCGCPLLFDAIITADGAKLNIDLAWFAKPANRVAEAIWVGFKPIACGKKISKLGTLIDPKAVVGKGQCRLHSTDCGVFYDGLSIKTLDATLVAPQEPSLLNFTDVKPLDGDPVFFNLYNNVWGTNFPMWYEENARFRFEISVL